MKELGLWTRALVRVQRPRLKARRRFSRGKFLLSKKGSSSDSGESVVVHHAQMSLFSISDDTEKGDDDPAMARNAEKLTVVGIDEPTSVQEKKTRTVGGIPSL